MEAGLREVCRSVRIGKILIQRVRPPLVLFGRRSADFRSWAVGRGDGPSKAVLFEGEQPTLPAAQATLLNARCCI